MSKRYASVDRSKEIKTKKLINTPFERRNLVLNINNLEMDNITRPKKQKILKTLNPERYKHKLPIINKQITSSHLGDINNSKTTELISEVNNVFSLEKDNISKNNLITETNNDNNDNYFKVIINSDFRDQSSIHNTNLNSGKKIIKPKIEINNEIKKKQFKVKCPHILRSERLYPKINKDNHSLNILKTIKTIRNNHLSLTNNFLSTNTKFINNNIAFDSRFENIVFDANKILKKHNFKENELKVSDNINSFISQNKELCLDNLLIKLIKKEIKI